jgi:hypothetical protein
MTQPYVMTWANAEPNSIRLTGPFMDDGAAARWGKKWEHREENVSDLLWQLVYLIPTESGFHAVPIETPTE